MNKFTPHFKIIIILIFFFSGVNCYSTTSKPMVFFAAGETQCDDDVCMLVLTSSDAQNWVPVTLGFGARDVVKGNKGYLAAGWCRSPLINTDGFSWSEVELGGDCWNRVSLANYRYFISGGIGDADDFSSLYSSADGSHFKLVFKKDEAPKITNVVYGNHSYIAVGRGENGSLISYNGTEWNKLPSYDIGALTFDGKQFVAINRQGTVGISGDGYCWEERHVDAKINYLIWIKAKHQYVAVGDAGKILTSHDARHWITEDSSVSTRLNKITWTYGRYVAVGELGTILTSKDGHTWEKQDSHTDFNLIGVA